MDNKDVILDRWKSNSNYISVGEDGHNSGVGSLYENHMANKDAIFDRWRSNSNGVSVGEYGHNSGV